MGIIDSIKSILLGEKEEEEELRDDDLTTDKYLKSLRRQRRVQLEQVEKEQLIRTIKDHERDMTRRNIFGFKGNFEQVNQKLLKTKKKILETKIFRAKQFMIEKKGKKPPETEYKNIFIK